GAAVALPRRRIGAQRRRLGDDAAVGALKPYLPRPSRIEVRDQILGDRLPVRPSAHLIYRDADAAVLAQPRGCGMVPIMLDHADARSALVAQVEIKETRGRRLGSE